MNISLYYTHYNRNVGRIKSIGEEYLVANINDGHGGGPITFPLHACVGFEPKVGDRVLMCVDDDDGHVLLQKLKKTRQENKSG